MKKLMMTCAALALSCAASRADFQASQPFDGGAFECSIVQQQPQDHDRNPIYKINVNVVINDARGLVSLGVFHTARNGAVYDRSQQYANGEIGQTPGRMEWNWSGNRGPARMVGTIYHNQRDGWMYREILSRYGQVVYTMLSDCHRSESE